jgi:PKD repeat protein
MKNVYYTFLLLLLFSASSAQTTLFNETFNSGGANWVLNTADAGSTAGATGNYWVINNAYNSFFGNTPAQPGAIVGAPNSGYLHIRSPLTQNATFLAPADGNKFAKMANGISTLGYTNVSFNFWYLCYGDQDATDSYFGRTYYSIDGGNTWILNPTTYSQINTWTQTTVSNPAFDNQPDLRVAFMWVQNSANEFVASDPTFSVDDFKITGVSGGGSAPVASFTLSNTSLCSGQCVQLTSTSTGQIDTYQWTTTGGTPASSTANAVNVCYANPGTYTITLTVTNANGTDSETNTITVTAPPAISSNPQTSTICSGQTISLQVSNANPGQLTTYSWSPNSGLSSTTGSSVSANPIVTTTYTIVGTTAGCIGTATAVITVGNSLNIGVNSPVICLGASTVLTASGASSYTWSPNTALNQSTGSIVTATPLETITYTVSGFNANGCSGEALSVVAVKPPPTIVVINDSICKGQIASLIVSGANTFSWSPSSGLNMTSGNSVQANIINTTTYVVTGTDANGCTASEEVIAFVYPETNGTISGLNATYFTNDPSTMMTGNPPGGAFSGPGVSGTNFNPATAGPGTHNITYTFTDANGCQGSTSFTVTVNNPLAIQGPTDEPYQALIYPNPSSGDVLMQLYTLKTGICTLDILDITGRQLQTSQSFIQSGVNQIPFKIDHAGIYLVRLTMHQHVRILKLVVE